jgi:hypothetical protein
MRSGRKRYAGMRMITRKNGTKAIYKEYKILYMTPCLTAQCPKTWLDFFFPIFKMDSRVNLKKINNKNRQKV